MSIIDYFVRLFLQIFHVKSFILGQSPPRNIQNQEDCLRSLGKRARLSGEYKPFRLSVSFLRVTCTVLPAKSDSDVMFCLPSYQGLTIDRSLVY